MADEQSDWKGAVQLQPTDDVLASEQTSCNDSKAAEQGSDGEPASPRLISPSFEKTPSGSHRSGSLKWKQAAKKVVVGLAISGRFNTLRDRHDVNEIALQDLTTLMKLGEGAFATVEKCSYLPPGFTESTEVAVKKLKPDIMSQDSDLDAFIAEVSLMRKMKHKFIVEYIGIGSVDTSSDEMRRKSMFLVTELMEGGTLKKLVTRQMKSPHQSLYSMKDSIRWCAQIAEALAYLHSSHPMIIHRDLKLENILLKGTDVSSQIAKLADFGLVAFVSKKTGSMMMTKQPSIRESSFSAKEAADSALDTERLTSRTKSMMSFRRKMKSGPQDLSMRASGAQMSGQTGTLMYMAPEMFRHEEYTEKVDVFSFGVVMYELVHKYMMFFAVSINGTPEEIERYAEKVAGGYRPPLNETYPQEVLSIISDAWAQDPAARPSMESLARRLNELLKSPAITEYNETGDACGACMCTIC